MTTQEEYDTYMEGDHTLQEKSEFHNNAVQNYEPDITWNMFAGLGFYLLCVLGIIALIWLIVWGFGHAVRYPGM